MILHQIFVQIGAVAILIVAPWILTQQRLHRDAPLLLFAGLVTALVAIQLIPLPPALWAALPGHRFYSDAAQLTGTSTEWRPWSLSPDLTLTTLSALLPTLATLFLAVAMPRRDRSKLMLIIFGWAVIGAILGLAQIIEGPGSALRTYRITDANSAEGLMANRNHHAIFLALAIAMLGPLATSFQSYRDWKRLAPTLAVLGGIFLLLSAIISGSRGGTLGALAACVIATLLYFETRPPQDYQRRCGRSRRQLAIAIGGGVATIALVVILVFASGKTESIERLLQTNADSESRVRWLGPLFETLTTYFPFGSGFGTFDPVYRRFEPFDLLATTYANQAHNELLQIAIEGGAPGLLLLGLFLWHWVRHASAIAKHRRERNLHLSAAKLGLAMTTLLLLFSLVDYPLRTPLLSSIFVVSCLLLTQWRTELPSGRQPASNG